jgi:hypothetical protein
MGAGDGEEGCVAAGGTTEFTRACPTEECRQAGCAPLKDADIEMLACLAARLAGKDPDQHITIKMGELTAFDEPAWRYPDFLARAEAAYQVLKADRLPE